MFCSECGAAVLGGAKFCGKCGAKVEVVDDKSATSNLVPSPQPIPSAPQERVQSMEGVQRIEAQGQSIFVVLLRVAAVIGGIIWGLFLVRGWYSYSELAKFKGRTYEQLTNQAFDALAVQSVVVIALVLWGFLYGPGDAPKANGANQTAPADKELEGKKQTPTKVNSPPINANATCPDCSSSLMSNDLTCWKCGADFTAAEGWRPIPRS